MALTGRTGGPLPSARPALAADWEAMSGVPGTLPTQTEQWARTVRSAGGWRDCSRLYELPDGRRLLLPLAGRGHGRAAVLASWPYGWGYGGAVVSGGRLTAADVELIVEDLTASNALRVTVVPGPFDDVWQAAGLSARGRTDYLTHVLDLRGGRDAVLRGYSTNVRRSIRRAERSGLEIRRGGAGQLLTAFSELHRLSTRRWAAAAGRSPRLAEVQRRLSEPPRRLAMAADLLAPALTVWGAFLQGRPVAAIVVLGGASRVLYWRGAMDRDLAAHTHANALLHSLAIEEALAAGAHAYSFGESDQGSALASYKAKFGATPRRWSAYHLEILPMTMAVAATRRAYGSASQLSSAVRRAHGDGPGHAGQLSGPAS